MSKWGDIPKFQYEETECEKELFAACERIAELKQRLATVVKVKDEVCVQVRILNTILAQRDRQLTKLEALKVKADELAKLVLWFSSDDVPYCFQKEATEYLEASKELG